MRYELVFLTLIIARIDAILECPKGSLPFDLDECDPNRRSQCPSGFTCRYANDTDNPERKLHLCCATEQMTIEDWFFDAGISPEVFPQPPLTMLKSVEMNPLDETTAFPLVHTGDEIVLLHFPQYTTASIRSVEFWVPPPQGGFLHVMTTVDPADKPFAVFLTYNLPSTGFIRLFVPQVLQGITRRTHYIDNSTSLVKRPSYRLQYVVLVYRTTQPIDTNIRNSISLGSNLTGLNLMYECSNVLCFLSTTQLAEQLGRPIAGSIFYITTNNTMFQTVEVNRTSSTALCSLAQVLLVSLIYFILFKYE
ncbi:hypothetical protein V3C99_003944 [Haemonchus contortus]